MGRLLRWTALLALPLFLLGREPVRAQEFVGTFVYDPVEGAAPDLLSLDVYRPAAPGPHPVVVYVHGGGWMTGDKSAVHEKARWLTEHGYVFVSTNYRLSPDPPDLTAADRVTYPVHPQDVGQAVGFVLDHAAEWGGDPGRIGLLGHSAGAHLVALVGTDGRFVSGSSPGASGLRAVVALDTGGYDIPYWLDTSARARVLELYTNAFTADRETWEQASPITHTSAEDPPMLLVHQGTPRRQDAAARFRTAAQQVGARAEIFDAFPLGHTEINRALGTGELALYDAAVLDFLEAHVRGVQTSAAGPPLASRPAYRVTPNPASTWLHVDAPEGEPVRIELFDSAGRRVLLRRSIGSASVGVRHLPPGSYVLTMWTDGGDVFSQPLTLVR